MVSSQSTGELDSRFSDPESAATSWPEAVHVLEEAELYWLTTVRSDGRPHVTPLIGVWQDGAVHFCTGLREQKARNLERNRQVAVTTGSNAWARGIDVVVEGTAVRVTDHGALQGWLTRTRPSTAVTGTSTSATASSYREGMPPRCSG